MDFFILYTSREHPFNFSLPQNPALVCQNNWDRTMDSLPEELSSIDLGGNGRGIVGECGSHDPGVLLLCLHFG